jgi:enoyl-CoA hydratase
MTWETLELERRDGIAVVRLARPPVNAVNEVMRQELRACFDELSEDRTVGAVVLSAQGERAFCAGVDLRDVAAGPPAEGVRAVTDPGQAWRAAQHSVRHCSVPVIAAVDAPAIGAGFGLVALCDLIVASTRASFGLTEINVGMLGGASKALRMVGPYKARSMFFRGTMVPATDLDRRGVLEQLVEPGQAEAAAVAIAVELAGKSPIALRLAKESILRIESAWVEDAYRTEQDYTARLRTSRDAAEATAAYLEKRDPNWTWT